MGRLFSVLRHALRRAVPDLLNGLADGVRAKRGKVGEKLFRRFIGADGLLFH